MIQQQQNAGNVNGRSWIIYLLLAL